MHKGTHCTECCTEDAPKVRLTFACVSLANTSSDRHCRPTSALPKIERHNYNKRQRLDLLSERSLIRGIYRIAANGQNMRFTCLFGAGGNAKRKMLTCCVWLAATSRLHLHSSCRDFHSSARLSAVRERSLPRPRLCSPPQNMGIADVGGGGKRRSPDSFASSLRTL